MVDLIKRSNNLEHTHTITQEDLNRYSSMDDRIIIPCNLQDLALAGSCDSIVTYFLPAEPIASLARAVEDAEEDLRDADSVEEFDSEEEDVESVSTEKAPVPVMGGCVVGFTHNAFTLNVPPAKMSHVAVGREILIRFRL